jgi:hypothetical protein
MLAVQRVFTILRKRLLYSLHNATQLITQLFVPLIILGLVAWPLSRATFGAGDNEASEFSLF